MLTYNIIYQYALMIYLLVSVQQVEQRAVAERVTVPWSANAAS